MNPGRYRLTLAVDGQPLMRGWWGSEATARRKFSSWIGQYGSLPGARVTLADEGGGETLTEWPGPE